MILFQSSVKRKQKDLAKILEEYQERTSPVEKEALREALLVMLCAGKLQYRVPMISQLSNGQKVRIADMAPARFHDRLPLMTTDAQAIAFSDSVSQNLTAIAMSFQAAAVLAGGKFPQLDGIAVNPNMEDVEFTCFEIKAAAHKCGIPFPSFCYETMHAEKKRELNAVLQSRGDLRKTLRSALRSHTNAQVHDMLAKGALMIVPASMDGAKRVQMNFSEKDGLLALYTSVALLPEKSDGSVQLMDITYAWDQVKKHHAEGIVINPDTENVVLRKEEIAEILAVKNACMMHLERTKDTVSSLKQSILT